MRKFFHRKISKYQRAGIPSIVEVDVTVGELELDQLWEVPLSDGEINVYKTIALMGNDSYTHGVAVYLHTVRGDVKRHSQLV